MRKEKTTSCSRRLLSAVLACAVLGAFGASSFAQENTKPIPGDNQGNAYPVSVNGFHVVDFRTENLVAPEGVDTPNPRFSWKLFSQDIGEVQSAYQITVTKAFEPDKVVWDSGKIESDQQLYVQYQ